MNNLRLIRKVAEQVVSEKSGHTFGELPHRFVVAAENYRRYSATQEMVDIISLEVWRAIKMAGDKSRGDEVLAAGVWCDKGVIYIDINESFESREDALEAARDRGELAIYDQVAGECLTVN